MPVITVDLDLEEVREYVDSKPRERSEDEVVICLLKLIYICRAAKRCEICRTRKGIHIRIYVSRYDISGALALRAYLCDDPIRIEIDTLRYAYRIPWFAETLFRAKLAKGVVSREVCVSFDSFINEFVRRL